VARVALGGGRDVAREFARRDHAVVAARADAEHLRVVDARNGSEGQHVVAVLAEIRRGDVAHGLAHRGRAVVTGRAAARDSRVIERRGRERRGAMAVAALIARRDVIHGLAERVPAVVAARARAERLEVVDRDHRRPGIRAMARVAELRGRDVLRRLRRCAHPRALRVTAAAADRRADELAVDVTALALREPVRTVEPKRGREVIEYRTGSALCVRSADRK